MTRVVVVDDHPVFRRGLVALLRASDFDVVAEAASGAEAVAVVDRERPDLVVMDLGLPELGGVAATRAITGAHPGVRVLVVTQFDDDDSVRSALAAGASGYVLKQASPEHILAAVDAVGMGAQWLGADVPRPFGEPTSATPPSPVYAGLTPREAAVADLLGRGLANPAIAERLGLSAKTVANYVSTVLLKLGAEDRLDAARIIRSAGAG
jgi:Response regulator containing a CheY-like receiver domain and an HTH DNA-binding domain